MAPDLAAMFSLAPSGVVFWLLLVSMGRMTLRLDRRAEEETDVMCEHDCEAASHIFNHPNDFSLQSAELKCSM